MSIPTYREYKTDHGRWNLINSLQPGDIFKSVDYSNGHETHLMVIKRELCYDERRDDLDAYPRYTLLNLDSNMTFTSAIYKRENLQYYIIG